eukprot:gene10085-7055_t
MGELYGMGSVYTNTLHDSLLVRLICQLGEKFSTYGRHSAERNPEDNEKEGEGERSHMDLVRLYHVRLIGISWASMFLLCMNDIVFFKQYHSY